MKELFLVFTLASLQIVQCLIPDLVVKKLDKTLIARKRQDTMELCRMFTEENKKIEHNQNHVPKIIKSVTPKGRTRYKRDINEERPVEENEFNSEKRPSENHRYKRGATMKYAVNPALNSEDVKRVENIVDKLYDDMEEKGQRVTYRQIPTTRSSQVNRNKTLKPSRRFDFAPAILTGPQSNLKQPVVSDDVPFESKARWKYGIVPYYIDFKTYDAYLSEVIRRAFGYVEKATCIRLQKLRERPVDQESLESVPWLYISNPTGIRQCVHSNEKRRVNGVVMTVFGYDCMSLGDIVHEVMHILGYSHEHLRSDRDQHISILWENIKPGYKKYFDLNVDGTEYDLESLPYDYSSILHYPPRAFSKNGQVTIMTEYGIKIGQREGLSEIDVEKVALIYSNECVTRNKEYLLETCPSVVKSVTKPINVTQREIDDYFKDRLWQFGIINFKYRDIMEFTVEERENIKAVFRHIEQETCLQFRNVGTDDSDSQERSDKNIDTKAPTLSADDKTSENNDVTEVSEQDNVTEPSENDLTEPTASKTGVIVLESTVTAGPEVPVQESSEDRPAVAADPTPDTETSVQDRSEDTQGIVTGPIPLGQDSKDNDIDDSDRDKFKAKIVITKPNRVLRKGLGKKTNMDKSWNNEVLNPGATNFRKMNLTMKKELLKRAKSNQHKRTRRDTSSNGLRRHANGVLILKRTANSSCICPDAGSPKGDKMLEIAAGCFNSVNDLLHFFVHVLGLDHQHNMHDRDNYLHVVWDNLTPDIRSEMKNKLPPAASAGFPYDYQSVMHYPWLQIKNGRTNIMYPIWNDGWAMGRWQGLSSVDVQKLNLLYFSQCMERQKHDKN